VHGKRKLVSLARNSRGQSVVEFALVLPLLFVLVFGITEFGRAWMQMNLMTSAAREGARLAVVTAPDVGRVTARVQEVCDAGRINPTLITVSGPDATDPDRRVTVTVEANFQVVTGTILNTFSGTIPLRATATMRHESF
jgi:Flp pilus assembly protein TadG